MLRFRSFDHRGVAGKAARVFGFPGESDDRSSTSRCKAGIKIHIFSPSILVFRRIKSRLRQPSRVPPGEGFRFGQMEVIDNVSCLLGDSLKRTIASGSKLRIAASCFSIYAFEALKAELETIDSLHFIFTSPTFVPGEVTDLLRKEHREFHIPKLERERSLYGSEFEVRLRNELTQKAIAKECADWMREKATFRSNRGRAPMQQFAAVSADGSESVYLPLHGFTAVDLGYEKGNAISNFVNRIDEQPLTTTYLSLFDQIWNDPEKLEDVTAKLCDHIASVYQENSPGRIYFVMLYNIFSEFLEDISADVLPNDRTGYQDSLV